MLAVALTSLARAQTAITYQGELRSAGAPASGSFDLRFRLYDQAINGVQVGSVLCADNVNVQNGRFTLSLDFGAVFAAPRFLEIDVRSDTGQGCGVAAGFVTLSTRQPVSPAPSATYSTSSGTASNADLLGGQNQTFYTNAGNLTGTLSDSRLSGNVPRLNAASVFSAIPAFNGGVTGASAPFSVDSTFKVTSLNADLLDGLDSAAFAPAVHTHDASAVTTGTLADARLSSNIGRVAGNQTWTGSNAFTGNNSFAGDGSGLTSLNAGQLVSGQVPDSRIPSTVARLANANTFTNAQTISTGAQFPFTVTGSATGGAWLRLTNTSAGGREWGLIATGSGNGEGPGRLLIRDGNAGGVRMAFDIDGDIGIGTVTPAGKLDLTASDPRFAIRNINDVGGGYIQQSGNALQLGLYNPSASGWGNVPANGFRAALGVDNTGRVGSLTNTGLAPSFRNILDDGNGNVSIQGNLAARNMPAIAFASSTIQTSVLRSNSATLLESISINVPGDGFIRIFCAWDVYIFADSPFSCEAFLELKETTGAEVLAKDAKVELGPALSAVDVGMRQNVPLEHIMPVSAGTRRFKVRLRHSGGGGAYSLSGGQISIMFFPSGM